MGQVLAHRIEDRLARTAGACRATTVAKPFGVDSQRRETALRELPCELHAKTSVADVMRGGRIGDKKHGRVLRRGAPRGRFAQDAKNAPVSDVQRVFRRGRADEYRARLDRHCRRSDTRLNTLRQPIRYPVQQ